MFKGQVNAALFKRVFVLRFFFHPGQTEAKESPTEYIRENQNYRYLPILIPDMRMLPPDIPASPFLYFVFLNRLDRPNELRWYRTLFTVSKDITDWGFRSFEFIDLSGHKDLGDAFDQLKCLLAAKKISLRPVRKFLDNLVEIERASIQTRR